MTTICKDAKPKDYLGINAIFIVEHPNDADIL